MAKHFKTTIDLNHSDDVICNEIRQLILQYNPDIVDENTKIAPLSGGNTNKLFKIDFSNGENVLCRINGIGTENLLDREKEIEYMGLLSQYNQGPTVFCTFDNGFIYDFIPGRTMQPSDLAKYAAPIAKQLAEFHKVQIDADKSHPAVFRMTKKWFNDCKQFTWKTDEKKEKAQHLQLDKIEEQIYFFEKLASDYQLEIVFCHNDLLAYNILIDDSTGRVYFIDYEYCGYNYLAFDIGNHFCEHTGFVVDPSKYPSVAIQQEFARSYLQNKLGTESVSDEAVEELRVQANMFSLVAHLFWGTWGLWQANNSNIDFDYLQYAGEKYAWFWQTREKCLSEFINFYEAKKNKL